jgi:hypothetical protein
MSFGDDDPWVGLVAQARRAIQRNGVAGMTVIQLSACLEVPLETAERLMAALKSELKQHDARYEWRGTWKTR